MLLSGSTRADSRTTAVLREIENRLRESGATTSMWLPQQCVLPIADPAYHGDPASHPSERVQSLVAEAERADAFVWGSPIYHNSFSGVLKNALDHLAIAQVAYKPVALVSHGGGRSTQAVDQLRTIVRGFLGIATPSAVCTAEPDFEASRKQPELASATLLARCQRASLELLVLAETLRTARSALRRTAGLA